MLVQQQAVHQHAVARLREDQRGDLLARERQRRDVQAQVGAVARAGDADMPRAARRGRHHRGVAVLQAGDRGRDRRVGAGQRRAGGGRHVDVHARRHGRRRVEDAQAGVAGGRLVLVVGQRHHLQRAGVHVADQREVVAGGDRLRDGRRGAAGAGGAQVELVGIGAHARVAADRVRGHGAAQLVAGFVEADRAVVGAGVDEPHMALVGAAAAGVQQREAEGERERGAWDREHGLFPGWLGDGEPGQRQRGSLPAARCRAVARVFRGRHLVSAALKPLARRRRASCAAVSPARGRRARTLPRRCDVSARPHAADKSARRRHAGTRTPATDSRPHDNLRPPHPGLAGPRGRARRARAGAGERPRVPRAQARDP